MTNNNEPEDTIRRNVALDKDTAPASTPSGGGVASESTDLDENDGSGSAGPSNDAAAAGTQSDDVATSAPESMTETLESTKVTDRTGDIPASTSSSEGASTPVASSDGAPVPPASLDDKAPKKRLSKKGIAAITISAAAVVLILCVANAMGAFHQHTWADATCTEPKTCTECGATEGDPLGHDYVEQDIAATCAEGGKRSYTCSRCGDHYTEDDGTPALGHTPGEWTFNTASSKMEQKCTTCGKVLDRKDPSREDVDGLVASQDVTVDSCGKVEQDPTYKALYPDMVVARVTNHSDKVMRTANLIVCAWDANGYPVTPKMMFSFTPTTDTVTLNMADVNLQPGATWDAEQQQQGWQIDSNYTDNIATLKGYVQSATFTDGSTWTNPYGDAWQAVYAGKQL